ncbi:hypothetical protein NC651_031148 [Populus alba x Populus x berolinensis]|nr:hypothetical protein NC651_031148 [Populus alba x Populus x berolinensis]
MRKQISKVARSNEFSEGLVALTQAFNVRILRGYQSHAKIHHDVGANGDRNNKGSPSFLNKVFEKPASPTGPGFVSVIVESFARNLVLGLYESVPSNRRLVLEVTGRVTFETVQSFLEFLLGKLYNGMRRCVDFAHEVVVDTDIEVVRYVKAKSSVIATLCISFCLHILDAAWILVPA